MLSISARGNAASAAAYYQHLESDPAGRNLEDYYSQDAGGIFLGAGAEVLGLSGPVTRENFEDSSRGLTPAGEVHGAGMDHRAGWDLTFSSPKSVSILWATADVETREKIEAAHDLAVERGLKFMEEHAAFGRRGAGGETHEKVGLVAAVYRHGTSREQDPQLHSHTMVFNVAPRADGTIGAIESRYLYEWKMAGGAAYRSELAQGLKELGFSVERDAKSFRVAGVPQALETEFSKRRAQIEKALAEHSARGAKASEIAALDTRKSKQSIDRETLLSTWQQTAREISPAWQPSQCLNQPRQQVQPLDIRAVQSEMTRQTSTVSEAQMYAAIGHERQIHGGVADIETSVHQVKRDAETVALDDRGRERFTTKEMQNLEANMVQRAERMSKASHHEVSPDKLQAAIAARPTLSPEQVRAVQHLTKAGDLAVVHGDAGTGKSFMLAAAREAWEAEGFRVRGASLSGKAAQELQSSSGIESTTLKRLEMDTRGYTDEQGQKHAPTDELSKRDVLVIDEAGMSGSRQTAALIEDAQKAGAKVVLVGDTRQLQAIGAGAAFRAITEETGSVSLTDIRRQQHEEDRQAVKDLRDGKAEEAIDNLSQRGRIHETETGRQAKEEAGQAVAQDLADGKQSLALTSTRAEARDVNEAARIAAEERGMLKGENVTVTTHNGEREFCEGDRVLLTRNNRDLDVKNGDLCTVQKVERAGENQARMTVALDRGGEREIDTRHYDHLDHGYCVTVHKAQGSTVDRAHILAAENGMSSREWAYVASSRAREETHLHGDRATLAEIAPAWSKSRQKDVTLDYSPHQEKPREREQQKHHDREPGKVHEWTR